MYLRLHQPVDDGLQGLTPVAREDALKVLGTVLQRLGDRQVQVVVGLLGRQVLDRHHKRWLWTGHWLPPTPQLQFHGKPLHD